MTESPLDAIRRLSVDRPEDLAAHLAQFQTQVDRLMGAVADFWAREFEGDFEDGLVRPPPTVTDRCGRSTSPRAR